MNIPFTISDSEKKKLKHLSTGRWANADLLLYGNTGTLWVVKDFSPCPVLVKAVYGRFMIKRELRALIRLQGISGIPANPFQMDPYALCYEYIEGKTLKESRKEYVSRRYFLALEELVHTMHERNIVHLDIRYMRNILVRHDGTPAVLDFQSSLFLDRLPKAFHQLLKDVDISGVYKCWQKINPETLDSKRRNLLEAMEKKRQLWFFKGYPLGTRLSRR